MRWVLAGLVLAGPAWAEPWIDYDVLFRQNADRVVTITDASGGVTRQLDMGDGVVVSCSDQGCFGVDDKGAVGCTWMIYSAVLAVAEVCKVSDARTLQMQKVFGLFTGFVAENAVPPRSVAAIRALHQSEVDRYREGGETVPLDCGEAVAPGSDVMMMIDNLTSQQIDLDAVEEALKTPRLPVMNPCL